MARLNTRVSSLAVSSVRGSSYLDSDGHSDQENQDPEGRDRRGSKNLNMSTESSPARGTTPSTASTNARQPQKRKRVSAPAQSSTTRTRLNHDDDDLDDEERRFHRYFDPNQSADVRREAIQKARALERDFMENRLAILRGEGDQSLSDVLRLANENFRRVKQTGDAILDSRLLANVGDVALKKATQMTLGDTSTGLDVDLFISKCITYMRNGGPLEGDEIPMRRPTRQSRRDVESDDDGDDDIEDAMFDWEALGRNACFPYNSRPPVPSFLLGPLSVEKRQRTQTQRRARDRDGNEREARPEAVTREALSQTDESGLTAICTRIRTQLIHHIRKSADTIKSSGFTSFDQISTSDEGRRMLKKFRLSDKGLPSLFDFVINPHSFGQTVENMFYVSFLIKEGAVAVDRDSSGLPTISPSTSHTLEQQRSLNITRHQAVFSLDYSTWQDLIQAFDITEPMIPHRNDDVAEVGQSGWYT